MSRQRTRHFAVALVLSAALLAASAVPAVARFGSPSNSAPAGSNAPPERVAAVAAHTSREVFGFALASSLSDPTVGYPSWNFDLLSTVAFFGLHVDTTGHFVGDNGWTVWNSSALANLVSIAHQHGTKVVLTVILQDFSESTPSMCAALTHADTTVAQAVSEVRAKGVDGVNIDYEGLDGACGSADQYWAQHAMTAFAQKMRAGLGSSAYLSVDTYAGAAGDGYGFFDIAGLSSYVDSMFVMAYDMEYSNYAGSPLYCSRFCLGPTSPLTGYRYSDTGVLAQYLAVAPASKIILGVPYYGRKACVGSASSPNQIPLSSVVADSYLDASGEAAFHEVKAGTYAVHRETNSAGLERWDTWYNTTLNCVRELYWDDAVSLGKKYDLVNAQAIRGVGLWNLNYGGGAPELWTALATHFAACSGLSTGFSPVAPANIGTPVTISGSASGCPHPQFEFWMRPAASSAWQLVQGYSSIASYHWNTNGAPAGAVYFGVWVRDAGSTAANDAYASIPYTLFSPCASVSGSFAPASPSAAGSAAAVTVIGSASGCSNPQYEFWMRPAASSSWQMVQGYSTTSTYRWNTNGAPAGTVYFGVWVRAAGSAAASDAYASVPYTLFSACAPVSESFSPASPAARGSGATVTVTGSTSGCPNPQYEFWMRPAASSDWQLVQGYSTSATYRWNTNGAPAGTDYFGVWVRDAASTAASDANASAPYTLFSPCASVSESFSPASPVAHGSGATVTITGTASGCSNPLYEFWMRPAASSDWQVVQAYSSSPTYRWNTRGAPAGTDYFGVWVRDAASSAASDAHASAQFTLS
jgi:spore germination protein YaaH